MQKQNIKRIELENPDRLTLLAFSDWHIHSIDKLIELAKSLDKKPDLILYGGDAVDRFVSIPEVEIERIFKQNSSKFCDDENRVFDKPWVETYGVGEFSQVPAPDMILFNFKKQKSKKYGFISHFREDQTSSPHMIDESSG